MYDDDNVLGLAEGCAIDDNLFGQLINIYLSTRFNSNLNTMSLATLAMVLRKDYLNINGHKLPTNCRECFLWYPLIVKR